MKGAEHYERAQDLAEYANVALTRDGDRDEAAVLAALAQVHADLAHVAALTGWDKPTTTARPVMPFGAGPYQGVPR